MKVKIAIRKISKDAKIPIYATEGASGFDLFAFIEKPVTVPPGKWVLIPTGIQVEIPKGFEIQIRPRSGLALKGITILNTPGTVDSDYRGEIKVILANMSERPFTIKPGERIAQGVLVRVYKADFIIKESLPPTQRGEGGFGSTGV